MTKQDWLKQTLKALGTFSNKALCNLPRFREAQPEEITIEELLQYTPDEWSGYWRYTFDKQYRTSTRNTQAKLRELGFTYEDGYFMQWNTKRELLEQVMKKCGVDKATATIIVDGAHAMGWGQADPQIKWIWEE